MYNLWVSILLAINFPPGNHGDILRLDNCWKYAAKFTRVHHNRVLLGSVMTSFITNKTEECIRGCLLTKRCKSINVGDEVCELNSRDAADNGDKFEARDGWNFMGTFDEELNVSRISLIICLWKLTLYQNSTYKKRKHVLRE